jgi:polysaccharide export outer membrane protein
VAEVPVKTLLKADGPAASILVEPHDIISVPTAETVYVIGTVTKPGSIVLNERETISVLQALSMAEGLSQTAKPQDAKILRTLPGSAERKEIPVDLRRVLAGRAADVSLQANDILFVPDNTSKKVAVRTLEAMVQTATGVVIWRR